MSLFVTLMIGGLAGLALMAIPGLFRHGHAGTAPHGIGHIGHGGVHAGHGPGHLAASSHGAHSATAVARGSMGAADGVGGRGMDIFRLIPSPRIIFSLMTLFGAAGYALLEAGHLAPGIAALVAVPPALLIERFAVTPLWNAMFRFQGTPSAPLDSLVMDEATAVTAFHNGHGMVSVVREGRAVQLRAELAEPHKSMPVRVGDALVIEDVDAPNERVTVSVR